MSRRLMVCFGICVSLALLAGSCTVVTVSRPRAVRYTFRYYPSACVYFDINRAIYYYQVGGAWRAARTLPAHIQINVTESVTINTTSQKPYVHSAEHARRYPPKKIKIVTPSGPKPRPAAEKHANTHPPKHVKKNKTPQTETRKTPPGWEKRRMSSEPEKQNDDDSSGTPQGKAKGHGKDKKK